MGRQIERHRQAHLPGRQIAPVKGVRFLGRREPGILANGPGPRCIHGRIGTAKERGNPRKTRGDRSQCRRIRHGNRRNIDSLWCRACCRQACRIARRLAQRTILAAPWQRKGREIRKAHHASPFCASRFSSAAILSPASRMAAAERKFPASTPCGRAARPQPMTISGLASLTALPESASSVTA